MIDIREQLDGLALAGEFIPQRPKGMHRSRYRALVKQHDELRAKLVSVELAKYANRQT